MTQREVIEKWLTVSSDRLRKSMDEKGIKGSGILKKSIEGKVMGEEKVMLIYSIYGMFVDMGVGKGRKLSDAQKLSGKGRRAKKWYSKSIGHEIFRLAVSLSDNAGEVLLTSVNDILPKKVEL